MTTISTYTYRTESMKRTQLVSNLVVNLKTEISKNGHIKNSKIEVDLSDNTLKLTGKVHSYFQKQVIISLANKILGNLDVAISDGVLVS